jgi:hypothetical protein
MNDVIDYCKNAYKRLVGLKAGLYDIMVEADRIEDDVHGDAAKKMARLPETLSQMAEKIGVRVPDTSAWI